MSSPDYLPQQDPAGTATEAFHRQRTAVLESLLQAAPDGILVVDAAKRVVSYNRRFVEMWGIPDEVVAAGDDARVLAAAVSRTADPDGFLYRVEALYADPAAATCDEILLADGRTFERHTSPLRGPDGMLLGRAWFFRDVSDRVRAVKRHRAVIESAMDCVLSIDRQGHVVEFNPAAERTFGYTRDEMLGREISGRVIPKVHRDQHMAGLERFIRTRQSEVLGKRLVGLPALRKDGTTFPTELTIVPLDLDGELVFTAFLRDITEQREAEARRDQAESEMRTAIAQAEAADRAKSQFLANMSHEVRTPMAAVIGYAEMLLDPRLGADERARIVHSITRNGRHLLALINDVLDLSKIEAGRLEVEHVRCRLWSMVGESMSAADVAADEKGVTLSAMAVGDLPRTITTDPTRFRQILDNLLSNAVKFTPAGKSVELRLQVDRRDPALVIEVEDHGIGIAPADLERLFQPFTQADPSTTRTHGGTGLGLSICKRLATAFGGEITVRSSPGAGSCFAVTLPLAPEDLSEMVGEAELTRESQLVRPVPDAARKLTGRVLLAEDNPDNRHILRYFLERGGLTVHVAENGRSAVEMAKESEFDLILMDMQMPEVDGYAATRLLRQAGYGRAIIALTAHAMAGDKEKCLEAGCSAHLAKPVDSTRLLDVVARHLPARNWTVRRSDVTRRPPPRTPPPPPPELPPEALGEEYRRSLPGKAEAIAAALGAGDTDLVARLAHKLRGSAGMYDLPKVSECAGLLEDACRENQDPTLLAELLAELTDAVRAPSGHGAPG